MSANPLQKAVVARLAGDAAILAIAGPGRVLDRGATRRLLPCLVVGDWSVSDWSTGTETGAEHRFEIEIWSEHNGRRQAMDLALATGVALHDAALALDAGRLVNLRLERTRSRREPRSNLNTARLEFRAVVEG
ncbi:uncharacterized protein DUF3168 [Hoeflea marina]|uniref:Uncharacterized protein DUF3168 n=1 Tax=Hoeflea marina TaxID=274592 RepID=A0A317PTR1_9HYPH|nr:DUF3168 domain-containing protein [Hoeflea marina]PWW02214.1 uncharacterized protein DUF3168 [Hoeflea marina]